MASLNSIDVLRADVAELRHEMQLGFARVDARFEQAEEKMNARFGQMDEKMNARFDQFEEKMNARFEQLEEKLSSRFDVTIERAMREQTRFFFLAWGMLLAAIIAFY